MMRERECDDLLDDFPAYRRPTASAWIAAVAVAFAVFVLGGFVKTYRQLEALKVESKREIQELRDSLETLRKNAAGLPVAARPSRTETRPAGPRREARMERHAAPPAAVRAETPPQAPPSAAALPSLDDSLLADDSASSRPRAPVITASGGLSSLMARDTGIAAAKPGSPGGEAEPNRIRVIAVNNSQKKIMVEGGRDLGFAEGARLSIYRSGNYIGETRVVEVFDNISACEVLHTTRIPEPGDLAVRLYNPTS